MGVIYKLKQEVIDLIVQKKKEDPSLSCRKLADLLYQVFNIEVSKSSINAVIKEYSLSNPVGRQAIAAPKNFFIPKEKKEQLLTQVAAFLTLTPAQIPPQELPITPVKEVQQETAQQEAAEPVTLLSDPLNIPLITQKTAPLAVEDHGLWLVRAFMQDRLRRPLIGDILVKAAGMRQEDAPILEAAVFLDAWGVHSAADLHAVDLAGLWAMFEVEADRGRDVLDRFLGKSISLRSLAMMLEVELRAAMIEADLFKIIADTGRCYYLSPDLEKFLPAAAEEPPAGLLKGIERAIDRIVTAREPLTLAFPGGMDDAAKEFLLFLTGQSEEKPDKIEFWSQKHGTLWENILKPGLQIKTVIAQGPQNTSQVAALSAPAEARAHAFIRIDAENKNIHQVLTQVFDFFKNNLSCSSR
jgi:hypothetical protein